MRRPQELERGEPEAVRAGQRRRAGGPGRADIINIAFPQNAAAREVWQVAFDFGVNANGFDVKNGSVILKDLVYYGGGLQWSTPAVGDGLAFGLATRIDLGSLTFAPNGRAATGEAQIGVALSRSRSAAACRSRANTSTPLAGMVIPADWGIPCIGPPSAPTPPGLPCTHGLAKWSYRSLLKTSCQ